jgi:hypothetical protein
LLHFEKKMTDVASVVQDRDSTVVLDDSKSGNNDLPLRVSLEEIVSDYVIIVRTAASAIPRFLRHIYSHGS